MENNNTRDGFDRRIRSHIRYQSRRLARLGAVPGFGAEDYEQELLLDLTRRAPAFNPSRASFRTFADRVVTNRIATLLTPTSRRRAERQLVSLEAPVIGDDDDASTLHELLPDDRPPLEHLVAIHIDVERFTRSLPPSLLICCEILLDDSVTEGARAAGIHRATVYERMRTVRARAEQAGLGIYLSHESDIREAVPVSDPEVIRMASSPPHPGDSRQESFIMLERSKPPRIRLLLTESELVSWFAKAGPGNVLEYHRGFLVADRVVAGSRLPRQEAEELDRLARTALSLAQSGRAFLLQRRNGTGDSTYLLIVREAPRAADRKAWLVGGSEGDER